MAENDESQAETNEEKTQESNDTGRQVKTWYPYITKVQFEKFLARLESKMPEQIDRDYVRAIIRTPSMIYRFLRGIEAMKFIDREHGLEEIPLSRPMLFPVPDLLEAVA